MYNHIFRIICITKKHHIKRGSSLNPYGQWSWNEARVRAWVCMNTKMHDKYTYMFY